MDEARTLRERAHRCRRMVAQLTDRLTIERLSALAAECEAMAVAAEAHKTASPAK